MEFSPMRISESVGGGGARNVFAVMMSAQGGGSPAAGAAPEQGPARKRARRGLPSGASSGSLAHGPTADVRSRFTSCVICGKQVPSSLAGLHVNDCLDRQQARLGASPGGAAVKLPLGGCQELDPLSGMAGPANDWGREQACPLPGRCREQTGGEDSSPHVAAPSGTAEAGVTKCGPTAALMKTAHLKLLHGPDESSSPGGCRPSIPQQHLLFAAGPCSSGGSDSSATPSGEVARSRGSLLPWSSSSRQAEALQDARARQLSFLPTAPSLRPSLPSATPSPQLLPPLPLLAAVAAAGVAAAAAPVTAASPGLPRVPPPHAPDFPAPQPPFPAHGAPQQVSPPPHLPLITRPPPSSTQRCAVPPDLQSRPTKCSAPKEGGRDGDRDGDGDGDRDRVRDRDWDRLPGARHHGAPLGRPPRPLDLLRSEPQAQARISVSGGSVTRSLGERRRSVAILQPGMVLLRNWLDMATQQMLVNATQAVAHSFHRPVTAGGRQYHIYSTCWGSKWDGTALRYLADPEAGRLPPWSLRLAQALAREANRHSPVVKEGAHFVPDIGLINYYPVRAEELGVIGLGGHQDLDDTCDMPVVSVSVGDSMSFFYRRLPPLYRRRSGVRVQVDEAAARGCQDGDAAHNREHTVVLESGDVLVFGGKSRLVYHGTRDLRGGTRPPGLRMAPGRLNFTFRQHDATVQSSLL